MSKQKTKRRDPMRLQSALPQWLRWSCACPWCSPWWPQCCRIETGKSDNPSGKAAAAAAACFLSPASAGGGEKEETPCSATRNESLERE